MFSHIGDGIYILNVTVEYSPLHHVLSRDGRVSFECGTGFTSKLSSTKVGLN